MDKYLKYWKRGWWAWLLMLCSNLAISLLVIPLVFLFGENQIGYWSALLVVWILIVTPLSGWLFEKFASSSARINGSQGGD
ncbi:hypothetical protein [Vreelandella sp. GE22]